MDKDKKLQFRDNLAGESAPCRNIAAILTVYDPPARVCDAITAILPQVDWLVVVDNADNADLRAWAERQGGTLYWLQNPANGLGRAQNLGIAEARKLGAQWVLLLDDDSMPAADMVARMKEAYGAMPPERRQKLGVMGAHIEEAELHRQALYIRPRRGVWFRRVPFGRESVLHDLLYVCASGSLIPLRVIDAIGGMEEDFFIYFIDTEFCLRARTAGYDICAVREARLRHRIGRRSTHRLLGFAFSTTNHPPHARHLLFRNRARLWLRYWRKQPAFVIFDLLRAGSEVARVALFERDKAAKLQAMAKGLAQQDFTSSRTLR